MLAPDNIIEEGMTRLMRLFSADYLREVGVKIFAACGAPPDEAAIVADELVETSLMGLDSHGVMRYIWYTEEVLAGKIIEFEAFGGKVNLN